MLASSSPRRRQILSLMGLSFDVVSPQLGEKEEEFLRNDELAGSLQELAREKARSVSVQNPAALVLGADTVVVKNDRALGKPADRAEAISMLRALSGSDHEVMTGVALGCNECSFMSSAVAVTSVRFRELDDGEIEEYLETGEYADKAGAYAIQGRAMAFVERIDGCYYNVVGLPVSATIELFKEFIARKDCADV